MNLLDEGEEKQYKKPSRLKGWMVRIGMSFTMLPNKMKPLFLLTLVVGLYTCVKGIINLFIESPLWSSATLALIIIIINRKTIFKKWQRRSK